MYTVRSLPFFLMLPPAHNIQLIHYVVKLNRIETLNSYTDTLINGKLLV